MSEALYRTILVPTDLSPPSLDAVRHAATLAEAVGSRVILTYVMEDKLPAMILAHTTDTEEQLLDRHREHARKALIDAKRSSTSTTSNPSGGTKEPFASTYERRSWPNVASKKVEKLAIAMPPMIK